MNFDNIDEDIKWADVFYFGGGHSEDLINTIKNASVYDKIFNSNKIICGISAGAIMLSYSGMGDRYAYTDNFSTYNYKMVKGLGVLPFTVCPHYDHNGLWIYNDECKDYDLCGFGLEDDTGIIVYDNKVIVIKQDYSKSVYFFDKDNDYKVMPLYEEILL